MIIYHSIDESCYKPVINDSINRITNILKCKPEEIKLIIDDDDTEPVEFDIDELYKTLTDKASSVRKVESFPTYSSEILTVDDCDILCTEDNGYMSLYVTDDFINKHKYLEFKESKEQLYLDDESLC